MSFLPDLLTLIAFLVASLVLILTPGPDLTLTIARVLSDGRKAGYAVVAGTSIGILIHTALVAFGLSALVVASPTAFWLLKIAGAVYLLWLAIRALFGTSSFAIEREEKSGKRLSNHLLTGLGVNLLNPKIIIFFMTFLPQFVEAGDPAFTERLLFLGVLFVLIAMPINLSIAYGADRFANWVKQKPKVMRFVDYCFAGVFSMFAVRILFTQGR